MPFSTIKRLQYGSVNGFPDSWSDQGLREFSGTDRKLIFGLAKLTSTLQTAIPIYIPSWRKDQVNFADKLLTLPAGCQVTYVGLRLPTTWRTEEESPYGVLPDGCTIIGTTGDKLKVSPTATTTFTQLLPAITAASSAYAMDAETAAWRGAGVADAVSPSLLRTLAGAVTLQVTCCNAGDTAAGAGIRLSIAGAEAFIVVMVAISQETSVPRLQELNLPIQAGSL